jgi:hypothetical protein
MLNAECWRWQLDTSWMFACAFWTGQRTGDIGTTCVFAGYDSATPREGVHFVHFRSFGVRAAVKGP